MHGSNELIVIVVAPSAEDVTRVRGSLAVVAMADIVIAGGRIVKNRFGETS